MEPSDGRKENTFERCKAHSRALERMIEEHQQEVKRLLDLAASIIEEARQAAERDRWRPARSRSTNQETPAAAAELPAGAIAGDLEAGQTLNPSPIGTFQNQLATTEKSGVARKKENRNETQTAQDGAAHPEPRHRPNRTARD